MPRVVIGVGLAAYPRNGAGVAWAYGNWALGFRQAGWEVWLVERLKHRKDAVAAERRAADERDAVAWWRTALGRFGLLETSTLFLADGGVLAGRELTARDGSAEALGLEGPHAPADRAARNLAAREEALAFAAGADLFLNISGHFLERDVLAAPRHRTYLDLDPLFTQVWAAGYGVDMHLDPHDSFATCGTRLGAADCTAPRLERTWLPTLPPVSLAHWKPSPEADAVTRDPAAALTTVTHWHGYPPIEWEGRWYDNKMPELRRLAELPGRTRRPLEIAGDAHPDDPDRALMLAGGWRLGSAAKVCATLDSYGAYLRASAGEFSVAKHGYVASRCGWFSDRTVCYLALGKPGIVQETGWSAWPGLGEGRGLLAFSDPASAAEAVNAVADDPDAHATAARALAEEHFDAGKVAASLVERLPL